MKLVWDIKPTAGNGRNSEGSFIRIPDGGIMFAYSRYTSDTACDHDSCDIAAIYSYDEGETWTEPTVIVKASDFDVVNIMSVSCIYQKDGSIGVYFLIKEKDLTSNFGRAISKDGKTFVSERIEHDGCPDYYVVNNDRFERFADGKLVFPAAKHMNRKGRVEDPGIAVIFVSEDDGKTFQMLPHQFALPIVNPNCKGMQEPGIIEHKDGSVRLWARTRHDSQFESYSYDEMATFSWPAPSFFTSPTSPMEMIRNEETGVLYTAYNPYPQSLLDKENVSWGRTPLIIRKSLDDGKTWSAHLVIEDERERGYCYPAMFFTKDNAMLCGYCRGGVEDKCCLARLGIMKIGLDEI